MAGNGGKRAGAGRKRGSLNKSNLEIKKLILDAVNFRAIVKSLERRSKRSDQAARILFEYAFGKPPIAEAQVNDNNIRGLAALFAKALVSSAGACRTPSNDQEVPE